MRSELEARIEGAVQGNRVRLVGAQPHSRAYQFVSAADIYVSTNMYGNLSNANLEAISSGACMVIPTSDRSVPIDTVTDGLIPEDAALRYDRDRLPASLAQALAGLVAAPAEIARRRKRTAALASTLIRPWAQCVEEDIDLLKSLSRGRSVPAVQAETS